MGPNLFIFYMNDLSKIFLKSLNLCNLLMTQICFCASNNSKDLMGKIETEIIKLSHWFALNKLSLNLNKAKIMFFGNCNRKSC